jgi:isocitrate/isopropylmalate dehydrogenase
MTLKIRAPGGDGIGPEVVDAALRVFDVPAHSIGLDCDRSDDLLLAMMLECTAGQENCAHKIEAAVDAALKMDHATRDIVATLGTDAITDAVIAQFSAL